MHNKKIVIGRLGDAHGVKGWLHLYSYATIPANIFQYKNWFIAQKNTLTSIELEQHQPHADHFVVKLKNCDDRNQALLLKHRDILINRDALPA
ncbi:MAG TPA: ribosome maturation factor RimM, partial [Coxiellaceae bacterium]|nr:ribosome maturation factor RimM [Coxiellaceae bacterium]